MIHLTRRTTGVIDWCGQLGIVHRVYTAAFHQYMNHCAALASNLTQKAIDAVMPENLTRFRHPDGPQGHIESHYPLADLGTGASGHGLSAAGGIAVAHRSSGLDTKVFVLMGDAETEEGMSYEARNVLNTMGIDNLIVSLDYNHFGIDGNINEVIASPYINHWLGLGWNVIEVDGHNFWN